MSIALSTHKVAAVAVGVAMVFSFAFVTPANAQTVEELTAQINSLLATISGLQAQLAGLTGGGTSGGSACYNFTLNHSQGDQGGEVMDIQKFLNANGAPVSATGAGSPGNETDFFGSRTKAAVMAWQNANAAAVLTPVGLSAGTGFWGPSSRAYANTMCGGPVTPGPGTGPVVPTGPGLTVAAAAQPGNGLAPESAARVPYTKFTLTNNSGTPQTVDSVTVERGGVSSNLAFDGIVLLDQDGTELGTARVLNSNNQATIGEAVVLQPGESRTFTVAANMEATLDSRQGEIATFSVIAINTSATVSGSLPITGAAHTINSSLAIGSVTAARGVEDPNATATKEIGTVQYTFTAVKLTAGSAENVRLHGIRFDQSGSASDADLVDVKVIVDGVEYTPTRMGDYYSVNFGSGIVINEGLTKEIVVKATIAGGTNRTVAFDVYRDTDINVTGETFGYGLTPTAGTGWSATSPVFDASVVTISAGTFNSVSKSNAAPAANIAIQTSDEILGAFTVDIKGEGINVGTLGMTATIAGGPVGTDLDNVTLVDQNGVVLAGPVDATGDATGDLSFSAVDFPSGVTTLFVKGFLDSTFGAADTIVMSTTPDTDWSDVTGRDTGDTITLPSSTATANTMTVQAAALTATTLTQPAARSIVPGATDFIFATATLDAANSGEDVRVTAVVVEDDTVTGDGAEFDNVEVWANLSGGAALDSVRGDRFETRVADAEQMSGTGTAANTLSISLDTHITVPKNQSIDIAIVGDLASSAAAADTHTVSLDTDSGDVTAVGVNSGSTVTVTPTGSGQTMTVAASGDVTLTVDSTSPDAMLMLDDTLNQQTVAVFRLAANNVENVDIDSIKVTSDGADDAIASYHFWANGVEIGSVTGGNDTAEVFFSDGTLVVPADDKVLVTVKVIMNNIDGTQVSNGDAVEVTIAASGDVDGTGLDSGSAIDPDDTSVDAATHNVYEGYPVVAFDNSGVSTTLTQNANHLLGRLTITNPGNESVTFDSTAGNTLSVQVQVVGDDTDTASETITVKDENGDTVDTGTITSATATTQLDFTTWTNSLTIAAGGSETISFFADTSDLEDDNDSIQIWLDDTAADVAFGVDSTGDFAEGDQVFKGDIFGLTHINPS